MSGNEEECKQLHNCLDSKSNSMERVRRHAVLCNIPVTKVVNGKTLKRNRRELCRDIKKKSNRNRDDFDEKECIDVPNCLDTKSLSMERLRKYAVLCNIPVTKVVNGKTLKRNRRELCRDIRNQFRPPSSRPPSSRPPSSRPPSSRPPSSRPPPYPIPSSINSESDLFLSLPSVLQNMVMGQLECWEQMRFTLKEWQHRVIQRVNRYHKVLAVHNTGCGKTLTAATMAHCWLQENPRNRVVFVSPASLISNFTNELKANKIKTDRRVEVFSFAKVVRMFNNYTLDDIRSDEFTLFIVDEVHNCKGFGRGTNGRPPRNRSKISTSLFYLLKEARKVLLLTATPVVNKLSDLLFPFIVLDNRFRHIHWWDANTTVNLETELVPYLSQHIQGQIDFKNCVNDIQEHFPEEIHRAKFVDMNDSDITRYINRINNINPRSNSFLVSDRTNTNINSKLEEVNRILRNNNGKTLIYTNWIEKGIRKLRNLLRGRNFKIIDGKTPMKLRQEIVREYNNNELQYLIITKAGSEGLDLKGTRNVLLLEPSMTYSETRQIIGRAVRLGSHSHLPVNQRNVKIFYMLLKIPNRYIDTDAVPRRDSDVYVNELFRERFNYPHDAIRQTGDLRAFQLNNRKRELVEYSNQILEEHTLPVLED
jgi:superfamily II DNA or RNA helicase